MEWGMIVMVNKQFELGQLGLDKFNEERINQMKTYSNLS